MAVAHFATICVHCATQTIQNAKVCVICELQKIVILL